MVPANEAFLLERLAGVQRVAGPYCEHLALLPRCPNRMGGGREIRWIVSSLSFVARGM